MKKNVNMIIASKDSTLKNTYLYINSTEKSIIKMQQTHSTNIYTLPETYFNHTQTIQNTDGLITTSKSHILAVKWADCLPIIIYHPKKILCVLHAGRKGSNKKILEIALNKLVQIAGTNEYFEIYMGPHICETCYEINAVKHTHFSLLKTNITQLKKTIPLDKTKLYIKTHCTVCHHNYYSYRQSKTKKRNYLFCSLQ